MELDDALVHRWAIQACRIRNDQRQRTAHLDRLKDKSLLAEGLRVQPPQRGLSIRFKYWEREGQPHEKKQHLV